VRAFGTRAGDISSEIVPRAAAASIDTVLEACLSDCEGRAPRREVVSSWSVRRRLAWLIAIRTADGRAAETIVATCPACRTGLELEIDLAACRVEAADDPIEFTGAGGRALTARLPTGADHARWLSQPTALADAAASLLEHGALDAADVESLDRALALCDPMRHLTLTAACPECGASGNHVIDLEQQLLRGFAYAQRQLLGEIDALARAYHWREADIVAMPAWRRAYYLARVTQGDA
jgi:hypothetical protein